MSEDAFLVASTADPETPLDAGPVLHVEEPWEGYATMPAKAIVARLASATIAELAAVRLYEQENRARRSIIGAVERALDRRR